MSEMTSIFDETRPLWNDTENDEHPVAEFLDLNQIRKDLSMDDVNIAEAIMNMAGLYGHYSVNAAKARMQRDAYKAQREAIESRVDLALRKKCEEAGERFTEGKIAARVALHSKVVAARRRYYESRAIAEAFDNILTALEMKSHAIGRLNKNLDTERVYSNTLIKHDPGAAARAAQHIS